MPNAYIIYHYITTYHKQNTDGKQFTPLNLEVVHTPIRPR